MRTNKSKAKPVSSWRCLRQASSMKTLQRVVRSLIFLVFGVHEAKAEEQEIQAQKRSEKDPCPFLQVVIRRKRILVNWNVMRVLFALNKKEKRNSQDKDPRTFEEPVKKAERKRSWRKSRRKRKRRKRWSTEGGVASFFTAKRKEEEVGKNGRKSDRRPRAGQVLGKSGRWLFLLVLLGQNWLCVNVAAEGSQERKNGDDVAATF